MDVLIFWTGPVCFEVFPGSDESLCVCLKCTGQLSLCWWTPPVVWWSSDARRCSVRASPARRGAFCRREGRMERCVDHDHGRLWIWHYTTPADAPPRMSTKASSCRSCCCSRGHAAPAPRRPSSSSWKRFLWVYVERNKPRLGPPRLCCSSHLRGCVRSVRFLCFK